MTLATAIEKIRRLTRTSVSACSNLQIMEHINNAQKEFAKTSRNVTTEGFVTVAPSFDIQTNFAIRLTVTGGTNALAATDISICATSAFDQTGTQVAAALQTAIQAAGPTTLTVAWSTTAWRFTIDAIDSTSITIAEPSGITYASALTLLGLGAETTTGTSVTGNFPTDCTVESALPTDFLSLSTEPEWDGDPLAQAPLNFFKSPNTTGIPVWYFIRNKKIMLYPPPTEQKTLKIWYKSNLTEFTNVSGYQEFGLSGKALDTESGLTASTAYTFRVNIDGGGLVQYTITTGTSTIWEEVIDLLNAAVRGCTFALVSGDVRCTSDSLGSASAIALAVPLTGTSMWTSLTGWTAFDVAVANQCATDLDVDDEYAMGVVYMACHVIAEENFEPTVSDRFFAQFKRILADFINHRANNNTSVFPEQQFNTPYPGVTWP